MTNIKSILLLSAFTVLTTHHAGAAEADYFTDRDKAPEVADVLDGKMRTALLQSAALANVPGRVGTPTLACDRKNLIYKIRDLIGRSSGVKPRIGDWSMEADVKAHKLPIASTIYKGISAADVQFSAAELAEFRVDGMMAEGRLDLINGQIGNGFVYLGRFGRPVDYTIRGKGVANCCDGMFKYKGTVVSSDKLEHFLQVGLDAYLMAEESTNGMYKDRVTTRLFKHIEAKLKQSGQYFKQEVTAHLFNDLTERGVFGLFATGVYSYGDKVANFEGYRFWKNLTEEYEGGAPYFACVNEKWEVTPRGRNFTFSDYINDGWDEAINCSKYRTESANGRKSLTEIILGNITEVMKKTPEYKTACPILPEKCAALRSLPRYNVAIDGGKTRLDELLHEDCRK